MAAIYHIIKNGTVQAVSTTGTAADAGYFGDYNTFEKNVDRKNPEPGSPLPPGNWREAGKTKVVSLGRK